MQNSDKKYDIAIIGAGPAGISTAIEAIILGIKNIIIFEKGDNHSMTIRKYYKDNKRVDKDWRGEKIEIEGNIYFTDGTKESTLDLFDQLLESHNVDYSFNTEIDSVTPLGDGGFKINTINQKSYISQNVVVAIGNMGKPNKPSYKIPKTLLKNIAHNLDKCKENEDVLVVGGGDSALEYAYYLADTNRVTINYRKKEFTRANDTNKEILQKYVNDGKIVLKTGIDIESLEDEDDKIKANFSDNTSAIFNKAVYAIGGMAPTDFLKKCNIEVNEKGFPSYDQNHQTSVKGLYTAGDVAVRTGGSIALSLNHGSKIVNHIKRNRAE
jgi:thioredoxin reductase (NADPH)